jgi:methylphosphotriester-DNA--protein-cysteine methyltransferase
MTWSRRALIAILASGLMLLACGRYRHAVGPDTGHFVAIQHGQRYHRPECSVVHKARGRSLLYYRSGDDAYKDGFTPCRICHPERPANAATPQ